MYTSCDALDPERGQFTSSSLALQNDEIIMKDKHIHNVIYS